jgi:CheY-like chemotaxis protein
MERMASILIVDDHAETCRGLSRLLRHAGHASVCLNSGDAALAYLSHNPDLPDLVILDVMMPGIDGMEVLRRVRADPRTQEVPVVMFSAMSDDQSRESALRQGANDYWVKGRFDFGQLKDKVDAHLH